MRIIQYYIRPENSDATLYRLMVLTDLGHRIQFEHTGTQEEMHKLALNKNRKLYKSSL